MVEDLLRECATMYTFDHPNVLKLIGVCLDGGPSPFIIMPYMVNGSLRAQLKQDRKHLVFPPGSEVDMVPMHGYINCILQLKLVADAF